MFDVVVLESAAAIKEAQHLAHQIQVVEMGWSIPTNNASGLRIAGRRKRLEDDFDATATWFGIYRGREMVGCQRYCGRLNGEFELERYISVPERISASPHMLEGTRLSMLPAVRNTYALIALGIAEWRYFLRGGYHTFTTAQTPQPGEMYRKRFGFEPISAPFRYHPKDPQPVTLMVADDTLTQTRVLANLEKLLARSRQTVLHG